MPDDTTPAAVCETGDVRTCTMACPEHGNTEAVCGFRHDQWDGPHVMRRECIAAPGHTTGGFAYDHGPWRDLPKLAATPDAERACSGEEGLCDQHGYHRHVPAPPAPALHDQLAGALRDHYLVSNRDEADADGNAPCVCGDWREPGPMGSDEEGWDVHLADAVLAVVQPVIDDLATRATQQAELLEIAEQTGNTAEAARIEAIRHAEEAEHRITQALSVVEVIDRNGFRWAADSLRTALAPPADQPDTGGGR